VADAIKKTGGVSTIYQRSYETHSSVPLVVGADVIFGFSPRGFKIEQGHHSDFLSHVAVGYIVDYRFPLINEKAKELRGELMRAGAKTIVAYFDESTVDDGRWFIGHDEACKNYAFWLQKVLTVPDLGVIFKAKRPVTLRQRLSPIANLLAAAEATGRCRLIMAGQIQGSYSPAYAALASDVAIHDSLMAGTAGLEAALAGVPTLLLDLEGWSPSPLYQLGPKVVFHSHEAAWEAVDQNFRKSKNMAKYGDWAVLLPELDPYRDGKAALRVSQYLKELLEAIRKGENSYKAIEKANDVFIKAWGKDKVNYGPGMMIK
jgi:hypothetical protein